MSHSSGFVIFRDRAVFWLEYDGTSDITLPTLHPTYDAMQAMWRKGDHHWECQCERPLPPEPVVIYAAYGGGDAWAGKACRGCMVLTGGRDPYRADDTPNNEPETWPKHFRLNEGHPLVVMAYAAPHDQPFSFPTALLAESSELLGGNDGR